MNNVFQISATIENIDFCMWRSHLSRSFFYQLQSVSHLSTGVSWCSEILDYQMEFCCRVDSILGVCVCVHRQCSVESANRGLEMLECIGPGWRGGVQVG